jgi:hypothetical protein
VENPTGRPGPTPTVRPVNKPVFLLINKMNAKM